MWYLFSFRETLQREREQLSGIIDDKTDNKTVRVPKLFQTFIDRIVLISPSPYFIIVLIRFNLISDFYRTDLTIQLLAYIYLILHNNLVELVSS